MQTPDTKTGHYYVTAKDAGRTSFLLGPFTQEVEGTEAHERALSLVDVAHEYLREVAHPMEPWLYYGTSRLPLDAAKVPVGVLNDRVAVPA